MYQIMSIYGHMLIDDIKTMKKAENILKDLVTNYDLYTKKELKIVKG